MNYRNRNQLFFTNKDEAVKCQNQYKENGRIKDCFHAQICEYRNISSKFELVCKQSSYIFQEPQDRFIGCPESCEFYQHVYIGRILTKGKSLIYNIRLILQKIPKIFKWYSSLTPCVQLIFAFVVLILIFGYSPVCNIIFELLHAQNMSSLQKILELIQLLI